MDIVIGESLACQPIEIVGPEVPVGDAIADDVVRRDEDAVADGHGGLLFAAPPAEARVLGAQVGAPRAAGPPAALDQHGLKPAVSLARRPVLPLARTLIVAGANPD